MAYNSTNPVSVSDPTRKSDYDRVFDNTVANRAGVVSGATTDSEFHIGEAADEGGWFTSRTDVEFIMSVGAELVSGSWTARATESSAIQLSGDDIDFFFDTSLTDGNTFTPTSRMQMNANGLVIAGLFLQMDEQADPSAPAANKARMYCRDTGGKTELVVRFATGAIQQIAIEP